MLGASRNSLAAARKRLAELTAPSGEVQVERLSLDLLGIAGLLVRELPLRRVLADPSTPVQAKTALLEGLLGEQVSPPALAFVSELAGARWSRPGDLADAVETLAVLACFEQALAEGVLDDVEDELFRFARIVERDSALREALGSFGRSEDQKRALLTGLLADKVNPIALRVITTAAEVSVHRRTVVEALDAFSRLGAEVRERLNARVTLAVEPTAEQLERLGEELSQAFGVKLGLRVEIDPRIIGGAVIRVGDQVLDASVARRLDIARRGLTEAS